VPLPQPTFLVAHGVLGLANPAPPDPGRDQRLIEAVRQEFPNVVNHQLPPPGMPVLAPHLLLASTSSQVALSLAQADFEVRFYGDYLTDIGRGLEYVERKLTAVRSGLIAADLQPSTIGLVATLHFSFEEYKGASPAAYVQRTLLRTEVPLEELQDALARVAAKVRDTYFVTLTASNFESRVLERPIMPGTTAIRIRPWEGRVNDTGIELTIDINNTLEGRTQSEDPVVTEGGIRAVTQMLREIATTTGPGFVETGEVAVESLAASSQP